MILLRSVGLEETRGQEGGSLFQGDETAPLFCRALLNDPEILFLDEPTSGLDPSTAEVVKGIIREKRSRGCTIFHTTHNMLYRRSALRQVAFINEGTTPRSAPPKSLKLRYGEASVVVEIEENGELISRSFSSPNPAKRPRSSLRSRRNGSGRFTPREATLEESSIA
jgi:fluoroquinolone transport system ATP-binding protein